MSNCKSPTFGDVTFANELKAWRKRNGDMLQKNACDVFGVPLKTLQNWEQGIGFENPLAKEQIRWRMAAVDAGVSVEFYRARYLQVIKQVAAEIQARK